MHGVLYWIGFILAALFLFFSVDDLFWDLYYSFWGRRKVRNRLRIEDLDQVPRRLVAILIPAWNEEEVVGAMVENLLRTVNYPLSLVHVFIGVYPNDAATCQVVEELEKEYPQVHKVVNPRPGPTSKAQNLNQIFAFVCRFEKEQHLRFGCFIIHDSEDVIHPTSLKLANYLSFQHEVIQLPVFPLQFFPTLKTFVRFLTSSTYADEFAENHYRGLLAREASGAVVPSAGTGFIIARSVLERLGTDAIFEEGSLTEDYKLSLFFAQEGIPTHFFLEGVERVLDDGKVVVEYVATREIFPNTLREAVKQKSRWIYGISFQSFSFWQILRDRRFSRIAKYSLYRDWKAKYGNLLPLVGYAVFTYFLLSLTYPLPPVYPRGTPSFYLSVILTFLMVERQWMRAVALKNVYGWRSAVFGCFLPPLLPLRAVWGNVVNFLATLQAWRIALLGFPRSRPRWQKTKHTYLSPSVLARYRRRLGDLLLEKRLIPPNTLVEIMQKKGKDERLGERLLREGLISEECLTECLGELLKMGVLSFNRSLVRWRREWMAYREVLEQYMVVPLASEKASLLLASAHPLSPEVVEEIKEKLQKEKLSVVLAPSSVIRRGLDVFKEGFSDHLPRLGEKLLERGFIQMEHLVEALRVQQFLHKPLGEILLLMGVVWPEDIDDVTEEKGSEGKSAS